MKHIFHSDEDMWAQGQKAERFPTGPKGILTSLSFCSKLFMAIFFVGFFFSHLEVQPHVLMADKTLDNAKNLYH